MSNERYIRHLLRIKIFAFLILSSSTAFAQSNKSYFTQSGQDTIKLEKTLEVEITSNKRNPSFYSNITRLKRAIIISYPIARYAQIKLREMRDSIPKISSRREQREYISKVEDEIVEQYTPILKRMSFYQGAVLLKLIDRQTGQNGYTLLKELKSGLSAGFWLLVSRIYGVNLKLKYDPYDRDWVMERYVRMYEREMGFISPQDRSIERSSYD